MHRRLRIGLCAGALALLACERPAPEAASAAAVETAAPDSLVEELPPAAQERLAPELPATPPAPEAPAPPAKPDSPPAEATRPKAAPTAAAAAVAAVKATSEEPEPPSLDILLKQPSARPPEENSTIDLSRGRSDSATSSGDPGALDRLRDHVRLERRSEPLGPAGPRQATVSETEAALRIPVDESVSLEGGVRVDSREDPGVKEPVRRSTPRVGVEVKF